MLNSGIPVKKRPTVVILVSNALHIQVSVFNRLEKEAVALQIREKIRYLEAKRRATESIVRLSGSYVEAIARTLSNPRERIVLIEERRPAKINESRTANSTRVTKQASTLNLQSTKSNATPTKISSITTVIS